MPSFVNSTVVILSSLLIWKEDCTSFAIQKRNAERQAAIKTADLQLEEGKDINKIIFLTFSISVKDSVKDEYDLHKKDVKYADGILKKAGADLNNAEPQYLYCELLNGEKERLDIVRVENPLLRVFEYSEEGSNQLQKKAFTAKTGEFVVRFNLNKQTKYLSVYKLSANQLKKIYHAQL